MTTYANARATRSDSSVPDLGATLTDTAKATSSRTFDAVNAEISLAAQQEAWSSVHDRLDDSTYDATWGTLIAIYNEAQ